jgi:hypothetical protein
MPYEARRPGPSLVGIYFSTTALVDARGSRILFTPDIGVPSHPQPLRSHLAPVFFLDLGAAPLCLQAAVYRAISIFLRLGRPVHV